MESKFELQFEDNEYYLVDGNTNDTVATTDKVLLKEYDGYMKKLSLKNCEDVANGYDLVELFDEVDESIDYQEFDFSSFKLGFKKAIEILGDKKFSEDDVRKAIEFGMKSYHSWYDRNEDEFIQSLQQTEWDVEIEMEQYVKYVPKSLATVYPTGGVRPKLDADGCLILKRK